MNKDKIKKLMLNKKIQKNLQALQDIVNKDDGITSISISCGDKEVKFVKNNKGRNKK